MPIIGGSIVPVSDTGVTGWLWMDAVVAIAVGINILVEGARLVRASAHGLMDASLPTDEVSALEAVLQGFASRGIEHTNLRTRSAGAESFIYIDVRVPPDWTILRTHDLLDEIEAAIHAIHPGARVFTHPEPISRDAPAA